MKRLIILAIVCCGMTGLMAKKLVPAKWEQAAYSEPTSIDITEYTYDDGAKIFYIFANDSTHLYVHARFAEETVKRQLLMGGFSLWVDTLAKGKTKMGVKYPIRSAEKGERAERGERSSDRANSSGARTGKQKISPEMLSKLNTMEYHNLYGSEEEVLSVSTLDQQGVEASLTMDDKENLFYTLKIPYKAVGLQYEKGKLISLTFEGNEIERSSSSERPSGGGGGMGGQSGGMGGGRSGGGGMGGSGSGMGGGGGMGERPSGGPDSSTQQSTQIKIRVKHLQLQ